MPLVLSQLRTTKLGCVGYIFEKNLFADLVRAPLDQGNRNTALRLQANVTQRLLPASKL